MGRFNWVDAALALLVVGSAWSAWSRGFLQVASGLVGFVATLLVALVLTPSVAGWLGARTALPPLWAAPAAFLLVWLAGQGIFIAGAHVLLRRSFYRASRSDLNRWLALLPGALHGLLIGSLLLALLAFAPLPVPLQESVRASALGGPLARAAMTLEGPLEGVFAPALHETLSRLAPGPESASGETVPLKFHVSAPTIDPDAEDRMLTLVNAERSGRGLAPLAMDPALQQLARAHAADMFAQDYFGHSGPDGRSPFDRMRDAGVTYTTSGENLALAPSTEFAHEALMNSPGHRANILNAQYHRAGIGVLDGGIYGKMFVQEFTN